LAAVMTLIASRPELEQAVAQVLPELVLDPAVENSIKAAA
jgi:hypothetical protein